MNKPVNIQTQIDLCDDPQTTEYLTAAKIKYEEVLVEGNLPDPRYAKPVTQVNNEETADRLARFTANFPFVETFSFAEFIAFATVVDAHLESKTKAKRGRKAKNSDQAAQMRSDVEAVERLYPGLRTNQLTRKIEYKTDDGWHVVQGNEPDMIYIELALRHGVTIQAKRARDIFTHIAGQNLYEPTAELMDFCRSQYPTLTKSEARLLLDSMGSQLFGVYPGEPQLNGQSLRDRFFARFLINMAVLARNPGCTPTWIPILIGEQGCGKSQVCRSLLPEKFKGLFAPITNTLEQLTREKFRLHVGFLLELPEVDALMIGKKSSEWMKNLITSTDDEVRFCYHPLPTTLTRRFGLIGTTNREDIFRDGTGSYERRYVPIQIPSGFKIPWESLRDGLSIKLWAAADLLACDYDGDEEELKSFTPDEIEMLTVWQRNYAAVDPWEARLLSFCEMRSEFTPADALTYLDVPVAHQSQADIRRVNNIIRKRLGARAKYKQVSRNGQRPWVWQIASAADVSPSSLSEVKATQY